MQKVVKRVQQGHILYKKRQSVLNALKVKQQLMAHQNALLARKENMCQKINPHSQNVPEGHFPKLDQLIAQCALLAAFKKQVQDFVLNVLEELMLKKENLEYAQYVLQELFHYLDQRVA